MAGFIQIIEFSTSRFEEGQKLVDKYRQETEGKREAGRAMTGKDRDNPNRYFTIVEFPSYEAAMRNNDLPETQALSAGLQKLADGPPTFHNLDLVRVEEG